MKRVVIESPYAGDVEHNLRYLRAAMHDCIKRGESPYASHALLTQEGVLDDKNPIERETGIQAGFAWREVADLTVVYTDLGITRGMKYGIVDAENKGRPIEYRSLGAIGRPSGWSPRARVTEIKECDYAATAQVGDVIPAHDCDKECASKFDTSDV